MTEGEEKIVEQTEAVKGAVHTEKSQSGSPSEDSSMEQPMAETSGEKFDKPRLWNPTRDAHVPTENEFPMIEKAFCRFVNFLKNRDAAGLSPESVRLLHSFYTELDSQPPSLTFMQDFSIESPVHELARHVSIARLLEGRHLNVLINLIILMVEEEQKEVQKLLSFSTLLAEAVDDLEQEGALYEHIRAYPPEKLIVLKALTLEHIRLKVDFISKIKSGRSLMVKCLDGSNRLLGVLRKKAARHIRKQTQREMTRIKESFKNPATSPTSVPPKTK